MKKIFAIFILILCASCSSDNDSTDDNIDQEQNILTKINVTIYLLGDPETIVTKIYENNRPRVDSIYSTSNDLWIYVRYFYNDNKLVYRETTTTANQFVDQFNIEYDELGRIIETNNITNSFTSNTSYAYDGETITSNNNNNGEISTKIFYLNNDGIIFKEIYNSEISEIEYDNNYNVTSLSKPSLITSYIYEDSIIPPDNFQFFENFMFGDYKNNVILYKNSINGAIFSDISTSFKYHLSVSNLSTSSNNVSTNNFEWIINEDNFPVSRNTYNDNDQLIVKFEYFY